MTDVVTCLRGAQVWSRAAELDTLHTANRSPVTARRLWQQTWAECHPQWQPLLVLVQREGAPVAAALVATRRVGPVTLVRGLAQGLADELRVPALDFRAARVLADGLLGALEAHRPWHLHLDQVQADEPAVVALQRAVPGATLLPGEGLPTVRFDEDLRRRPLSRNTRDAVSRARNRAARSGEPLETRWLSGPAELEQVLPEMRAVHRARDHELGRRSHHDDPRVARFYDQVVLRHAAVDETLVLTLRVGGVLAAYVCCFRDGSVLRVWDNRVSPAFTRLSAGRVANAAALQRVADDPALDELDWMRGEEPYKLQSATHVVPAWRLVGASSPLLARTFRAAEAARELKRSSPALTRTWNALHARPQTQA